MSNLSFKELLHSQNKREITSSRFQLAEEQLAAIDRMEKFLEDDEPVLVLQGYAGTGKTSILNEYIQYLDSIDCNFCLCAPTHRAKMVMEEVTGYSTITVHKLLSLAPNIELFELDYKNLKFRSGGFGEIPESGIVIIDESSMINDEIYKLLTEMCGKFDTKLLFIGDKAQIQAVGDNHTSLVFNCSNIITLTKIHRQTSTNGLLPLLFELRENPMARFESIEAPEGSLLIYNNAKDFMLSAAEKVRKAISTQNVNETKLIAYTNNRVRGFNECIRKLVWDSEEDYHKNEILTGYSNFEYNNSQFYNSLDYIVIDTPKSVKRHIPYFMKLPGKELELYDSVYKQVQSVFILDKDIDRSTLNTLGGQIESIRIAAIEAKRAGNRTKSKFLWQRYYEIMKSFAIPYDLMWDNRVIKKKTFDYGYASTVHKIQGGSINTVFVDMKNVLSCRNMDEIRQMQYVALSRTKTDAYILT